jgi:hypothetical protein|nr:MAG TPA: NinG protein [Caudoviricetes sp.]
MKHKPCKSTKTKGFGCGTLGEYSKSKGLCQQCYYKWLYGTDEGREQVTLALEKARKQRMRDSKKEAKDAKERAKLLDSGYYKDLLKKEVQKIARLIDYGNKCLARDTYARKIDGGHVLSKGAFPSAAYNLHNIFVQTAQSNHFGNEDSLMKEGLERIFGKEYREFNNSLKQIPPLKYTSEEYKELCSIARRISNDLKADLRIRTSQERIEKRNEVNVRLGIYSDNFSVFRKSF